MYVANEMYEFYELMSFVSEWGLWANELYVAKELYEFVSFVS